MTATNTHWPAATRDRPCPKCGKLRCKTSPDGGAGYCWRNGGRWRQEGRLPRTVGRRLPNLSVSVSVSASPPRLSKAELELIDRQCRADLTHARLAWLAGNLRLSMAGLTAFGVGWHYGLRAFTFPMVDADGVIVGIRTRTPAGKKRGVSGSRLGIFVPETSENAFDLDVLLVAEGPTDAAAALDLGFAAIGRPDCSNLPSVAVAYARRIRPPLLTIVADADAPGQRGADELARRVAAAGLAVSVLTLPDGAKDLRDWMTLPESGHHALAGLLAAPADCTIGGDE